MWLFVPETSSPSVPASAASNADCNLLSTIGERLAEASCTWRGKQQQPQAWSRRWKQGGFIRLLSGVTHEPSTAQHGVDAWISSLRATRARETALPGSASVNSTTAGCSTAPSTSSIKAGLVLSSARTCRGTRTDNSPSPSQHWKDWAAALRAEYSARPKLTTPCAASDCSSWPSATVAQRRVNKSQSVGAAARPTLDIVAEQWMGPNVPNGGRSTAHAELIGNTMYHDGKKVQLGLESQAARWAGPAAQNHKGSSEGSITRADGKSREDILSYQAEQFFRPPSSPDQPIAGGSMSSTDTPNSNQPSVKRKLNPIFVEALMRWPTGLSGFERQEMAWTRWWLLMPSFLSALYSKPANTGPEQMDLFGEAA